MSPTVKLLTGFILVMVKCKNIETNLREEKKPLGQALLHSMSGLNVNLAPQQLYIYFTINHRLVATKSDVKTSCYIG